MKHVGRAAALAGLAAALWLVWRSHPGVVLNLLREAGAGLLLASIAHVLPMLANARDWQILIRGAHRPNLAAMLKLVWIRESINQMLPVARVGGEIVSFRLMKRSGLRPATAAASLVADIQLTLISQLLFTLAGIGYLLTGHTSGAWHLAGELAWGVVALAPVLTLFAFVQHVDPFERTARMLNKVAGGHLVALVGTSSRIDRSLRLIWRRHGVVLRYLFVWQTLQTVATALELWIALYFLGAHVSFVDALVIEILIQAVSSAAFFVPGGLGVQEGGFVLIGGVFGLDPSTSLALAGARRVRDLVIYLPGLAAWQIAESSRNPLARFFGVPKQSGS